MLIQYLGGALATFLVELAFGPGSTKPRAIGLGFAAGLFALNALPEPLEINYFPHIRIPVRRKIRETTISGNRELFAKPFFGRAARRWPTRSFLNRPRKSLLSTNKKCVPRCNGFRGLQRH
jgi:hypothetical protein